MWSESESDKSCNVREYLDYENYKCRKELIGKLVLEFENEILNAIPLNTTNTFSNNFLIYIILLVIMRLILLAIVCISCYYQYTRCWLKKEYLMSC